MRIEKAMCYILAPLLEFSYGAFKSTHLITIEETLTFREDKHPPGK
jgi:hypothetical protein